MNLAHHVNATDIQIYTAISKNKPYIRASLSTKTEGSHDTSITREEAHQIVDLMFNNLLNQKD